MGGFSGEWGAAAPAVQRKRALLESEGVVFDADGRVSAACVLHELPAPGKRSRADDKAPPAKRSRTAPTRNEIATETPDPGGARSRQDVLTVGGAAAARYCA